MPHYVNKITNEVIEARRFTQETHESIVSWINSLSPNVRALTLKTGDIFISSDRGQEQASRSCSRDVAAHPGCYIFRQGSSFQFYVCSADAFEEYWKPIDLDSEDEPVSSVEPDFYAVMLYAQGTTEPYCRRLVDTKRSAELVAVDIIQTRLDEGFLTSRVEIVPLVKV